MTNPRDILVFKCLVGRVSSRHVRTAPDRRRSAHLGDQADRLDDQHAENEGIAECRGRAGFFRGPLDLDIGVAERQMIVEKEVDFLIELLARGMTR
ncbi:hypothetical protein EDC90_10592 [Martelella mediterranea]|uniref:Uncharacterized protein n=1 Tax=Martelella mediterranea TaxID=293089 RepID=A0A4R3NES0_9HYPH|nr:hypothetical protein EDC90_10592 [Martelella mediterranea]